MFYLESKTSAEGLGSWGGPVSNEHIRHNNRSPQVVDGATYPVDSALIP